MEKLTDARILIVDDQEPNVLLVQSLLKDEGYEHIRTTLDSRQVLDIYREFQPDLIVLDLQMPYVDGYGVMRQLREYIPRQVYLPILVLTADVTREAKQRALKVGAKDFLTKPLDYMEVLLRIGNLLETRALYLKQQGQNLILEERVRERTAELTRQTAHAKALSRTAERLNANLDLASVLHTVCEETIAALETSAVAITLLSGQQREVKLAASIGLPPFLQENYQPVPLEQFKMTTGQFDKALLIRDFQRLSDLPQAGLFQKVGIQSMATAQLERDGELLGHLSAIGLDQFLDFADDELTLLQAIADQAAQAINNARLYQTLQNYTVELEDRVAERTAALVAANEQLQTANEEVSRALEQERELNELKSRFLSMASHEFRTPLTSILSSSELLQRYGDRLTKEKINTYHQRIQTSVKHMTTLVDEVLLVEKSRAGLTNFAPTSLDLRAFCQDMLDEFMLGIAANHQLSIHFEGADQDGRILGEMDEESLRRILHNLVSNAVKYSAQGSRVDVWVISAGDKIRFVVKDEGIGIPAQDQPRLFEFFHRAVNVGVISGTGLGLYIVKQAVDQHGGTIQIQSQEGQGSTFTVELPASVNRKS